MTCYHPVMATRSHDKKANGKHSIEFGNHNPVFGDLIELPCSQCIGCRIDKSKQWATRCMHEAQLHNENTFITLTYDDDHLPEFQSLNKKHFQDFMKRLRKSLGNKKISYFHCGEYGGDTKRPHYHALIFGHEFKDKELYTDKDGEFLYTSEKLNEIWGQGQCLIGDLTFESAAYVTRYIIKGTTENVVLNDLCEYDNTTGLIESYRKSEYATMSRNPAIGKHWYAKFHKDVFPEDFVIVNGFKTKVPTYYDNLLEKLDPELLEQIKQERNDNGIIHAKNNTDSRLKVRKKILQHKINQKKRKL